MQVGDLHDLRWWCRRILRLCQEPTWRGLSLRQSAGGRYVNICINKIHHPHEVRQERKEEKRSDRKRSRGYKNEFFSDVWVFSQWNNLRECFVFLTEEYEVYMKKQEATFTTEVTAVVQEPKVGDVPPVVVTTTEQMTTTVISGQVRTSLACHGNLEHINQQGGLIKQTHLTGLYRE